MDSYLEQIPEIYMSTIKEPSYFSPSLYPYKRLLLITDKKQHMDLFNDMK